MYCGFINKDFSYKIKEITKEQALELAQKEENFTINVNNEYFLYFIKETYIEENIDAIMKVTAQVNKELLMRNKK